MNAMIRIMRLYRKIIKKFYTLIFNSPKKKISTPLVLDNVEYNKKIWDKYSKDYNKWEVHIEANPECDESEREKLIEYLGDEWGTKNSVTEIMEDYVYPYIDEHSIVAEIGVGGGRIASIVAPRTKELYCFDVSNEMLKRAKNALKNLSNVHYILIEQPKFKSELAEKFDFVYSFDVFVHLDLHTMWNYFNEIGAVLKKGGKAFIHTSNLMTPEGWKRFSKQKKYSVEGHYFISPEIVDILANRSNLKIIKKSTPDPKNYYLNRDYLVVLKKP